MNADIHSDGRTVWINGSDGSCLGRFSRSGIDVHKDAEAQIASGHQCLDCKGGPTTRADWAAFQAAMLLHHRVYVSSMHMPRFLRRPT